MRKGRGVAYYKAYSAASLTLSRNEDSTKAIANRMAKNAPTTVPQTPLPNVTYASAASPSRPMVSRSAGLA